jgi:hypothetical protein
VLKVERTLYLPSLMTTSERRKVGISQDQAAMILLLLQLAILRELQLIKLEHQREMIAFQGRESLFLMQLPISLMTPLQKPRVLLSDSEQVRGNRLMLVKRNPVLGSMSCQLQLLTSLNSPWVSKSRIKQSLRHLVLVITKPK